MQKLKEAVVEVAAEEKCECAIDKREVVIRKKRSEELNKCVYECAGECKGSNVWSMSNADRK